MSNKTKIAIFTYSLGFGGTERVVSILNNELDKYYDVSLVLFYNDIEFPIRENSKVIVLSKKGETNKPSVFGQIKDFIWFAFKYKKLMKQEGFKVSISFLAVPNLINSFAKLFNKNLKTIISERIYPSLYKGKSLTNFVVNMLFPIMYNKNDLLFSNSVYINNALKQTFKLKLPLKVVYNPIHTKDKKPDLKTYKKDAFKVINVGRLSKQKNQQLLLEAFNKLPEKFELTVLGGGELKEELKEKNKTLQLEERVRFKGSVNNVMEYHLQHHCFAFTSQYEGFPNALLEAMVMGLPVISTNCMSGPLELLNDNEPIEIAKGEFYKAKYGLLINTNDAEALVNALFYFETHEEKRQIYSELAYKQSQNYNIKNIGLDMKQLIDSVL